MPVTKSSYSVSRAQWNKLAARFNSSVCDIVAGDRHRIMDGIVNAAVGNRKDATLVDLGCGMGTFIQRYGRKFGAIVGSDFAERMLRGARRRCATMKHVRWVCVGVEDAPRLLSNAADLTVCLNVLTSPDAALRRRQWKALAQVTKPGGRVIVVLPSLESSELVAQIEERLRPGSSGARLEDGSVHRGHARQKHYTRAELRAAAERGGLRVQKITRIPYPWKDEGVAAPKSVTRGKQPWDWVLVARRNAR